MEVAIEPAKRYRAFISYSHRDRIVATWVQRTIERYQIPAKLVGSETALGKVPARLHPLFRDRDELPASGDLGNELITALHQSLFLILICSPAAAKSRWVNDEVLHFKRIHGEGRVLALICDGEPGDPNYECFPKPLQFLIGPGGELSDVRAEPIAADMRKDADGRRLAKFKLIAGLTGLRLDDLLRRESTRRARRLTLIAIAASIGMVAALALAVYANRQREVAEHQRQLADKSVEFLTGTFAVANPATENPRTITVLSIIDRASKRAGEELHNEPEVAARLLQTTGQIYISLGLPKESERDLYRALALSPVKGETRARILLGLAANACAKSDAKDSRSFVNAAEAAIEPLSTYGPALNAEVAFWRAKTQFVQGNYAKSVADFNRALALYQTLPGDYQTELGRAWMGEGLAFHNLKKFVAADSAFARAEAIYTAKFGTNHVLTAQAMQSRALGALVNEHLEVAATKVTQAIAIYKRVLEPNHPTLASSLLLLGRIDTARGDYQGAVDAFDQSRAIYSRLYGPRTTNVGDVDFFAAEAESGRGRDAAALQLLGETKRIYDKAYGANDPDQVELLMARVKVFTTARRMVEATSECSAAVRLARKLDPNDPTLPSMQAHCDDLPRVANSSTTDR